VMTVTGRVAQIEPYFAAADFAINPMFSGAGTNVKMADFIAARLPILSTEFGARGFNLAPGVEGLRFDSDSLLACIDQALTMSPEGRKKIAQAAYAANAAAIDMKRCVQPLVDWLQSRTE
jgi:Glycosyl transferases group 1